MVEGSPDAIVFGDARGVIRLWNAGAAAIFGFTAAEARGGTHGLGEDALAQLALHGVPHHAVDRAPKDLLQATLDPEEVEQSDGPVQLEEEFHVARRAGFTARDRSREIERSNPQLGELGPGAR
jgi:PAS domain-containing protein